MLVCVILGGVACCTELSDNLGWFFGFAGGSCDRVVWYRASNPAIKAADEAAEAEYEADNWRNEDGPPRYDAMPHAGDMEEQAMCEMFGMAHLGPFGRDG